MSKHTPGPWIVAPDGHRVITHPDNDDAQIAACAGSMYDPDDYDECLANTRLMAAAPELLEALRAALFAGSLPDDIRELGMKAVAKAEGKS